MNETKKITTIFSTDDLVEKYTYIYIAIFIFTAIPAILSLIGYIYENKHDIPHSSTLVGLRFSLFIIIEWILGKIILKYIRKNNKLMLLGTAWKFILLDAAMIMAAIVLMLATDTSLTLHLIIFILANILCFPMYTYSIKNTEKLTRRSYTNGAIFSVIFGILGIITSRFLNSTGNENIVPIIAFYASTFAVVILNNSIALFIYYYINYDKVYTKEVQEILNRTENKVSRKSKRKRMKKGV